MLTSVNLLTSTIASDYSHTLAKLERLTSHGEITFDLFYAILIPRSLMVARCAITGLPRIFKLTSWVRTQVEGKPMFQLNLESVDLVDRPLTHSVVVGRVQTIVYIRPMAGTVKIDSLDAYPLKFHADPEGLKESIRKRGKKWVSLIGVHHKQFDGLAALKVGEKLIKHNVCILLFFILLESYSDSLYVFEGSGSHHGRSSNVPSVEQQLPDAYSCSSKGGWERCGKG
jgi:hypothetical protein